MVHVRVSSDINNFDYPDDGYMRDKLIVDSWHSFIVEVELPGGSTCS